MQLLVHHATLCKACCAAHFACFASFLAAAHSSSCAALSRWAAQFAPCTCFVNECGTFTVHLSQLLTRWPLEWSELRPVGVLTPAANVPPDVNVPVWFCCRRIVNIQYSRLSSEPKSFAPRPRAGGFELSGLSRARILNA